MRGDLVVNVKRARQTTHCARTGTIPLFGGLRRKKNIARTVRRIENDFISRVKIELFCKWSVVIVMKGGVLGVSLLLERSSVEGQYR